MMYYFSTFFYGGTAVVYHTHQQLTSRYERSIVAMGVCMYQDFHPFYIHLYVHFYILRSTLCVILLPLVCFC